ncbi:unnamed protein product [Arctia plantaginis]|uniref:ODAD1 central coiled coil region domain-containing protein n=1 Tax=Arctia plantaginis TaxID=874455 RepID=A0A8S0ZGX5_ARCPL|nr:unnamed protein product [Arctia plantaginis]
METPTPDHPGNDLEVLKKMEDEHLRLQRQVKVIQIDRLHRTMGVHPQCRSQDELLRCLKSEYNNLCKDLKIARSGAHKKKDKKMKQDLKDALLFRLQAEQECEAGLIVTSEIDDLLVRNNKDTTHLRKIAHTARGQLKERRIQSERRLISTENKLETAQLRFNDVQCQNNKIREEIEHMLKDRVHFNQAWNKMLIVLNKGKKFLGDLFESSTLAYDQRDEWVAKLKSIQEKGKIDQMLQIQEMRDLIKAYNHEMKLYHFLATKGVTRINKKQEQKEEQDKIKEEEKILEQYHHHIKILDEIFEFTEKISLKDIQKQFLWWEQQIDSLYNLMTEYCAENEVLLRDVKRIRQETNDRRDYTEAVEEYIAKRLTKMQNELEIRRAKTEELMKRDEESQQVLKTTMNHINDIFNLLGCSLEPYQNLLGDKGPSVYQIKLTLLLITEKIKEYKEIVYYYERFLHKTQKPDKTASRFKKYTVHCERPAPFSPIAITALLPADPCSACVETRWLSRISDGLQLPFTSEQALRALEELSSDPAYLKSDRIHTLTECKVPRSRALLARRYMNY